jgi:hypothetical protein
MPVADRRKLLFVGAVVLLANFVDLASTWLVSPNLAHEWNLLQRQFGLGWSGLIGAKLFGGLVAILGYRYYLVNRVRCYPPAGLSLSEFCRYIIFGRHESLNGPQSSREAWRRALVSLGYFWAGLQILVIWVALDNLLLGYGLVFPGRRLSESGYHLIQSWLIGALVFCRFFLGNYRDYKKEAPADGKVSASFADRQLAVHPTLAASSD